MYLEDRKATTDEEKADLFNTFFLSGFTKSDYQRKIDERKLVRIDIIHFSRKEIETALQALNIGKANGPGGLGNLPLKRLATNISKSLELVFNTIGNKHELPMY